MKPSCSTQLLTALLVAAGVGSAHAGTIDSSAFNGVSSGAVSTAGTLDWGYFSFDGGTFDSNLGNAGLSYNNTPFALVANNNGNILTTTSLTSAIGLVTLTEGTTGTNTVDAQTNNANYTFDGNASFGSYGGFAPGEQNVWTLKFNDLGIGNFNITLYLGHSSTNRSFDFDVTLDDGGTPLATTTTTGGTIAGLGSSVAAYGSSGASFTYNITVTTTTAGADLTLVHSDTGGGSAGGAIFAGYTVTGTLAPEPGSLALLGLGTLLIARRRR